VRALLVLLLEVMDLQVEAVAVDLALRAVWVAGMAVLRGWRYKTATLLLLVPAVAEEVVGLPSLAGSGVGGGGGAGANYGGGGGGGGRGLGGGLGPGASGAQGIIVISYTPSVAGAGTPARTIRLFEGFTLKINQGGTFIIQQEP
jgi:hypothetical protein